MVACLIKAGADPECGKDTGRTALTLAIVTGQNDVLRHLIECGADVNVTLCTEISVLH
jgi:ankyrin repeat protein